MNDLLRSFHTTKIPMVEIFQSVSGEGVSAGEIVTFVRVAGCDLRCTWCDTKYSFKESGGGVEQMIPETVIERLRDFGSNEIICTGGEPLEHNKSKRYLPLYLQSEGFKVRIETSGGSDLYTKGELEYFKLKELLRPVYTMDIKCPASGMQAHNNYNNFNLLDERDELKFVVADDADLAFAVDVIDCYKLLLAAKEITINFSPVFESMTPQYLVDFLKRKTAYFGKEKLKTRLSLQLHKFIWPPHLRGV